VPAAVAETCNPPALAVFLAWCYIAAVSDSSAPAGQDAGSWLVGAPPAAAEQRHLAAAPAHTLEPAKHGMGHEAAAPAAAGAPATIYEDPVHEAELAEGGAGIHNHAGGHNQEVGLPAEHVLQTQHAGEVPGALAPAAAAAHGADHHAGGDLGLLHVL